jgi:hypothetical protein
MSCAVTASMATRQGSGDLTAYLAGGPARRGEVLRVLPENILMKDGAKVAGR